MPILSTLSKHATSKKSAAFAVTAAILWTLARKATANHKRRSKLKQNFDELGVIFHDKNEKTKVAVDGEFFQNLKKILKILIPEYLSLEGWYILMIAFSLGIRTFYDVWMIQNGTSIESSIVSQNNELFKTHLFKFIYAMPAISLVNNMLKYGLDELKLRFRTRLTTYLYDKYLKGFTYYKMSNLDNRISNADQLLTQDVEKLSNSIAELYSNLSKPLLDIVIYSLKLTGAIGAQGPSLMLGYLVLSGLLLTRLRRPTGRHTITEQKLEGEFRYVNSRLIANSEEVAFYQGNKKEQSIIIASFQRLVNHLRNFIFFRFMMGLLDNVIAKYIATVVGYYVVSRPFLGSTTNKHINSQHSERLEDYYQSGRMLVKMAEAIGRVVLAGRELTRLAGFTARITEFMNVLDNLNNGDYKRTMVSTNKHTDDLIIREKVTSLIPGSGKIVIQDKLIKKKKVPTATLR